MPKNKVSEWSATASNNTDIGGINIAEGCAPSGINNAIRELMAQVKDMQAGSDSDGFVVAGTMTCSGPVIMSSTLDVSGATTFSNTVILGGSATATTQTSSDDSTKVATTEFVKDVALPDLSGNGIAVRTAALTLTPRTITAGTGITVADGDGVAGNPTITNSGVTSVNGNTGAVVTITSGTAVTASGTSVTFGSIPSSAKRVTLLLDQISTNGTSPLFVRLGTSGGMDSSNNYSYVNHVLGAGLERISSLSGGSYPNGFCLSLEAQFTTAGSSYSGEFVFSLINSNNWIISGQMSNLVSPGLWHYLTTGRKSLGGALTQLQIYTLNGTDTFDAGTFNILYE
jgi:hypothetical protein